MRRFLALVAILLAATAGACLGLFAHVAVMMAQDHMAFAVAMRAHWGHAREASVLGGALAALLLAGGVSGMLRIKDVLRDVAGATFGAGAGFLLYVLGYLSQGASAHGGAGFYAMRYWGVLDTLTVAELAAAILGALLGLLVIRFRWRLYGVLAYVAFIAIVAGYFAYVFNVALPRVPQEALPGGREGARR